MILNNEPVAGDPGLNPAREKQRLAVSGLMFATIDHQAIRQRLQCGLLIRLIVRVNIPSST
jgi:hypothetical protein